jgi:hypothetical protein
MEPDWTLVRGEDQLKGEKGAATALALDEVQHPLRPRGGTRKTEGVPIGQLSSLLHSGKEVIDLFTSRHQLACAEVASNRSIFSYQFYVICHVRLFLSNTITGIWRVTFA